MFSQPKYDYIGMTIDQMDTLESRVIDFVTARYSDRFTLADFPTWYKVFNKDVLDSLETPFKEWLISYFETEKVAGLCHPVATRDAGGLRAGAIGRIQAHPGP